MENKGKEGRREGSRGSFNNYLAQVLPNFDPFPSSTIVDILYDTSPLSRLTWPSVDFLLTPSPSFCPRSYWMIPSRVVKWEETKNRVMNHCNSSSRCLLQFYFTLWSYYLLPTTHHCDRKFQVLSKNSLFWGLLLVKYICTWERLGLLEMPISKAFYGRNYLYSSKPFYNFE